MAIATVCIILTNIIPLRISLLMFAALCYYIAFEKSGWIFGCLAIVASLLIAFFSFGISSSFLLTSIVFAPYSILTFGIKKFYYTKPVTAAIRVVIMIVFANIALMLIFFLAKYIAFDFTEAISILHGYFVLAIIVSVLFVIFDFLFNQLSIRLCKLIK